MVYKMVQKSELRPQARQIQRLMATQEMQKALMWLQLPQIDLAEQLTQEIEENPLLEIDDTREEEKLDEAREEEKKKEEEKKEQEEAPLDFEKEDLSSLELLDDSFSDLLDEPQIPSSTRTREDAKLESYHESLIQEIPSLIDILTKEAIEIFQTEEELYAARIVIGHIDERGFLMTPLKEISLSFSLEESLIKRVLEAIKTFDPPGVGAQSLQESLELQLMRKNKGDSIAYKIIHGSFSDLLANKIPKIAHDLSLVKEEIISAIDEDISCLDIHPGMNFSKKPTSYITPDLMINEKEGALFAEVNQEYLPQLRLNRTYLKMLQKPDLTPEEKLFLQSKAKSAKWLIKTLFHRQSTLEQIGSALLRLQRDFFLHKNGQLKPMTMRRLADELHLHESTIARAVDNKYMSCARGLLPLRSFFTSDFLTSHGEVISSKTVKEILTDLIAQEDKSNPLSDEKIASIIQAKGIVCARRTVAKFRTLLGIGNKRQRKKWV